MNTIIQVLVFFLIVLAITKPLGLFMYRVFAGERTFLSPLLRPVERGIYRVVRGRRNAGDALDDLHGRADALQPGRPADHLRRAALAAWAAVQPARAREPASRGWRSIPPPRSPPTPTGRATCPK